MRTPAFRRHASRGWLLASLLCAALPAHAADPAPAAPTSWLSQSVAIADAVYQSTKSGVASAWGAVTGLMTPSQPYEALPDLLSDDDRRFFAVLDAVGLKLSEVKFGGVVMSSSQYRFVAAHEPSVADFERAARALDAYRATAGGLRAGAKERIARNILDLAGDRNLLLTAVAIELSPWPNASYEMNARSRPPEASERRVMDGARM